MFFDDSDEFIGDSFADICKKFNVTIQATQSPWADGLNERHNPTLTTALLMVKDDAGCDNETTLSWLLCKNLFD